MKDEYIIISKTAIQKRIEELESYNDEPETTQLKVYQEILSQSTPLIPEIEKALKESIPICEEHTLDEAIKITENYQKWYISNLKLDI